MKIASWNVRRNSKCVDYAFEVLEVDVLLTQECRMLSHPKLEYSGDYIDERWVKHSWGNVTFSRFPIQRFQLETEYKGSLNLTGMESDYGKLALVNIYGLFEKSGPHSSSKMASPGLHRKLSDLSPLFWDKSRHDFQGFLVMGDLNHDRRMDVHPNFKRRGAFPHEGLMKRIEDFQMTDLLLRDFPEFIQTYRSVRGNFPWQLDHAFISNSLAKHASAHVVSNKEIEQLSDHNPVVVTL